MFSKATLEQKVTWIRVVMIVSVIVAAGAAANSADAASSVPYRNYQLSCVVVPGDAANIANATPIEIDGQDDLLDGVVGGADGGHMGKDQWVYFRLWGYSYKYKAWYSSPFKRTLDGYPKGEQVEAWTPRLGGWATAVLSPNAQIGVTQVGIAPSTGSGLWYFEVETYWAPPFSNPLPNDLTTQAPAPGGLDQLDAFNHPYCTF
jgi:hypothetical protein